MAHISRISRRRTAAHRGGHGGQAQRTRPHTRDVRTDESSAAVPPHCMHAPLEQQRAHVRRHCRRLTRRAERTTSQPTVVTHTHSAPSNDTTSGRGIHASTPLLIAGCTRPVPVSSHRPAASAGRQRRRPNSVNPPHSSDLRLTRHVCQQLGLRRAVTCNPWEGRTDARGWELIRRSCGWSGAVE